MTTPRRDLARERLEKAVAGEFEILRELGRGGMGSVYLARDVHIRRHVAIKVSSLALMEAEGMGERFMLEVQSMGALQHSNIVGIHMAREAEGILYFVMDYVEGVSVAALLKRGSLPLDVAQWISYQVGMALTYAHRKVEGLVHRDIKPANILVDRDGNARVTDFGIAKVPSAKSNLTRTGLMIGTPEFMSPEHCEGANLTPAADQYSLGVVAFKMLAGIPLFPGNSMQVLIAQVRDQPPSLESVRPGEFPEPVTHALERMLAKRPEERWPSISDAVLALGGRPLTESDPTRLALARLVEEASDPHDALERLTPTGESSLGASSLGASSLGASKSATGPSLEGPVLTPSPIQDEGFGGIDSGEYAATILFGELPPDVGVGELLNVEAWLEDSVGTRVLGQEIQWSTSDPSVATIDDDGALRALAPGRIEVTATTGLHTRSVALSVVATVARIVCEPEAPELEEGHETVVRVTAYDASGGEVDFPAVWSSSDQSIVLVDQSGRLFGVQPGSATVQVTVGDRVEGIPVVVSPPKVAALHADTTRLDLLLGDDASLEAIPLDGGGKALEHKKLEWSSDDPAVVSVDEHGRITTRASGNTVLRARCEGAAAEWAITVAPRPAASVEIDVIPTSFPEGATHQLSATVRDDRGELSEQPVRWEVVAGDASVTTDGLLTLSGPGEVRIVARCGDVQGGADTRVEPEPEPEPEPAVFAPPPLADVVDVPRQDVEPSRREVLAAATAVDQPEPSTVPQDTPRSRNWAALIGVPVIGLAATWGVITLVGGEAETPGGSGVSGAPVGELSLSTQPASVALDAGESTTITASLAGPGSAGAAVEWASTDPEVATVGPDGTVFAVAAGSVRISATSNGVTATTSVTVRPPTQVAGGTDADGGDGAGARGSVDPPPTPQPSPQGGQSAGEADRGRPGQGAVVDAEDPDAEDPDTEAPDTEAPDTEGGAGTEAGTGDPSGEQLQDSVRTPMPTPTVNIRDAEPERRPVENPVVTPPAAPTIDYSAAIAGAVDRYVGALRSNDAATLRTLMGGLAESSPHQRLLEVLASARDLSIGGASAPAYDAGASGEPTGEVTFSVPMEWRSSFGARVARTVPFIAQFGVVGSEYRLQAVRLAPGAEL